MVNNLRLNKYKQEIVNLYNRRSESYDDSDWHKEICDRLVEYSQVECGQCVLDIGTGTGHIAIAVAQIVGDRGRVVGIDIAPRMLEQARRKIATLTDFNLEFRLLDAESLDYQSNYFDRILCANTFPWIENKQATLNLWYSVLKSGGRIAVHTPANTAYIGAVLLNKVLAKHGIFLEASNRIGSVEQCINLFKNAGFEGVEIKTERYGSYTTLKTALATWSATIVNSSSLSLRTDNHKLSKLSSEELALIEAEFNAELKALETEAGIWDELTTWYVLGCKP